MERGDDADSGYTRFRNLDEYHVGNGWTVWNDLTRAIDVDPDYRLRIDDGHIGATVAEP